ncbi:MAG: uroporphyrinogen-III synthase [Marinobacterium sp.]|nr:uroporphyrinogen-III synthase [Marinobacterium sp.]
MKTEQSQQPLHKQRILVTRPAHQAGRQIEQLQQLGANVIPLPLQEIVPVAENSQEYHQVKSRILDLDLYHQVIFVSANAARIGTDWIDLYWPQLPVGLNWLAIGRRTAAVLDDYGITAFHSDQGYDSEALLAAEPLQAVDGQKILIMRGQGGRELLASTLQQRGAQVEYADLYQRRCPRYSTAQLDSALATPLDALLVTSAEALDNLQTLAGARLTSLQQHPLIVPSERIAQRAQQQSWQQVRVAQGPDDCAMIQALLPDMDFGKRP